MSQEQQPDPTDTPSKPSVEDLLRDVGDSAQAEPRAAQVSFEQRFVAHSIERQIKYVHLGGLSSHYRHKGLWSGWLLVLIVGLMAFQSILIVLVGADKLNYSNYQWLLPALLVQNLAQVVGLAVFVVRALFKDTLFGESK